MTELPLQDRIAVVSGGGSGVGRSISLQLGALGATLCLVGRSSEKLRAVSEALPSAKTLRYSLDLATDEGITSLLTQLKQDLNRVDILVHSAATISLGKVETASARDFDNQYRTNVRAPFLLSQGLLPMLKASHGQIVFINSSAGLKANREASQYSATKHALRALADSLRDEVNGDNVQVLSVFLGRTATPMQEHLHSLEGRPYRPNRLLQPDDVATMVVAALRLPRSAEVTEITMRPLAKIC